MSKIKVGDIVTLKSGSPEMTVTYAGTDTVHTAWVCDETSDFKGLEAGSEAFKKKGGIALEYDVKVNVEITQA